MVVAPGSATRRDSIPTRRHALPFIFTYVADAGSSPTRIVARIGVRPVAACSFSTRSRSSPSSSRASALPSRIRGSDIARL